MLHDNNAELGAQLAAALKASLTNATDELSALPAAVNDATSGTQADRDVVFRSLEADLRDAEARVTAMTRHSADVPSATELVEPAEKVISAVDAILDALEKVALERFSVPPADMAYEAPDSQLLSSSGGGSAASATSAAPPSSSVGVASASNPSANTESSDCANARPHNNRKHQYTSTRATTTASDYNPVRSPSSSAAALPTNAQPQKLQTRNRDQQPAYHSSQKLHGQQQSHHVPKTPSDRWEGTETPQASSAQVEAISPPRVARQKSIEIPKTPCMADFGLDAAELDALQGHGRGGGIADGPFDEYNDVGGRGGRDVAGRRRRGIQVSPSWDDDSTDLHSAVERSMTQLGIETPREVADRFDERRHLALRGVMAHMGPSNGADGIDLTSVAEGYSGEGRGTGRRHNTLYDNE